MAFCARVAGLANPRLFQPRQPMLSHYSACSIPVVGSAPLQRSGLLQQGFLRVDLHSAPSTALGRDALGPQWTCPTSCPVELEGLQAKDPPRAVSPLSGRHDGAGNLSRRTGATARRRVEVKVIAMKMSSGRLEGYVVPQAFQLAHRAAGNGVAIPLFEVMIAQVHIVLDPVNNAVADDGDAVGHRQGSPIGPDAAGQASVLGAQIGLGASGGFGRFHQGCFQPGIAFARRTALALFALCLLPGQTPAQGARCPAVGKAATAPPTSAAMTSAVRRPTPGMVSRAATVSAKGCSRRATSWSSRSIWASKPAMRSSWLVSMPRRWACRGVQGPWYRSDLDVAWMGLIADE